MLQSHLANNAQIESGWEILQNGVPTVLGFAQLCGAAMARLEVPHVDVESLSVEARVIACAAKNRGVIELRGNKNAFEPTDRLLAVCITVDDDHRQVFKKKSDPRQTMAFLEGFRQLCAAGLVVHHLMFDFSLTQAGFALADSLDVQKLKSWIEFATIEPI